MGGLRELPVWLHQISFLSGWAVLRPQKCSNGHVCFTYCTVHRLLLNVVTWGGHGMSLNLFKGEKMGNDRSLQNQKPMFSLCFYARCMLSNLAGVLRAVFPTFTLHICCEEDEVQPAQSVICWPPLCPHCMPMLLFTC